MVNRISQNNLTALIKRFLKAKIPFKKVSTTGRTLIISDFGSFENKESRFPANELHFIKSVKEHVIKNGTYKKIRNYFTKEGSNKKIKYFFYNKNIKPGDIFNKAYEVDINNAYWDTAYHQFNLFDEDIYNKGLTVSKKSRLAAIGSFAKVKYITEFDGQQEKNLPPERSKKTEFLWNTICNRIGRIMARGSRTAKSDFLFFWVDAIFVKDKETAKRVQKLFKEKGYNSSISLCEWVKFDQKGIVVKSKAKGKDIETKKEEIVIRDGKRYIKTVRKKEWKDERPFPYAVALSEKDINSLTSVE